MEDILSNLIAIPSFTKKYTGRYDGAPLAHDLPGVMINDFTGKLSTNTFLDLTKGENYPTGYVKIK